MFLVKSTFGTSPGTFQAFQTASSPLALVMTSGLGAFSSSTEPLHFWLMSSFFFWARAWDGTAIAMTNPANSTQASKRNIDTPKWCVAPTRRVSEGFRCGPRSRVGLVRELRGRSRGGRGGPHLRAGAAFVFLEVIDKQLREFFRRRIVRGFVAPGVARPQDFRRHAGARRHHVEAKHGIAFGLSAGQGAAMNGIDDAAGVGELDALADAVSAATPARVDQ